MVDLRQGINPNYAPCDPEMVEKLIAAASNAMQRTAIPDITTPSEVASATFILLDRTLRGIRKLSPPQDRAGNAREFSRILTELIIDHGKVPN